MALTTIAIAGCGGAQTHAGAAAPVSPASHTATHPQPVALSKKAGVAIELSSAGMRRVAGSGAEIDRRYTCDGADQSPPLRWSGIPANAAELALFVTSLKPVANRLFFDWAVAGIDPRLKGLQAGQLPTGAVAGRNGLGRDGYSICPPGHRRETYLFVLFAPPKRLSPSAGFEPLQLRKRILRIAPDSGLLGASYAR